MTTSKLLILSLVAASAIASAEQPDPLALHIDKILDSTLTLVGPAEVPSPKELRVKAGDKVAFMGDSITAGGGYIRLAAAVLQTNYPDLKLPYFINSGVSGQKAENMEPRFTKDMHLADKPAWSFISVGINDVWHRLAKPHDPAVLAEYRTNITKMVAQAQAAGATVVLLTPTVIMEDPNSDGNQRLPMYVAAMKEIAVENNCLVIDLHGMFLRAIHNKPADLKLTADGVHMGAYGDAIMAIGVLRAMGVPDATMTGFDTLPLLRCKALNLPLKRLADLLEIPATRFEKNELRQFLSF